MPGTIDALPAEILHYNTMETFPVLSYPMNNMDGLKTKAKLLPPADPGRKYGLHGLGLVNTRLLPSSPLVRILTGAVHFRVTLDTLSGYPEPWSSKIL